MSPTGDTRLERELLRAGQEVLRVPTKLMGEARRQRLPPSPRGAGEKMCTAVRESLFVAVGHGLG